MLLPIYPEATTRLRILFIRGGVFHYYMGRHTFQTLYLWQQVHFVY
jgi:hypothetical protein